jgi:hypothetical protein
MPPLQSKHKTGQGRDGPIGLQMTVMLLDHGSAGATQSGDREKVPYRARRSQAGG